MWVRKKSEKLESSLLVSPAAGACGVKKRSSDHLELELISSCEPSDERQ